MTKQNSAETFVPVQIFFEQWHQTHEDRAPPFLSCQFLSSEFLSIFELSPRSWSRTFPRIIAGDPTAIFFFSSGTTEIWTGTQPSTQIVFPPPELRRGLLSLLFFLFHPVGKAGRIKKRRIVFFIGAVWKEQTTCVCCSSGSVAFVTFRDTYPTTGEVGWSDGFIGRLSAILLILVTLNLFKFFFFFFFLFLFTCFFRTLIAM